MWVIFWPLVWTVISQAQLLQNQYSIGPVPEWSFQNIPTNSVGGTAAAPQSQGLQFDIIDSQIHAAREEHYTRMARTILNESGLQNGSSINIAFDPSYQKLTLHFIEIKRGSETLNRLNPAQLRVIQQEQSLERHIYDGRLSVVAFLEDVRVGDRIDYAFTVAGQNPILDRRFAQQAFFEWQVPVSFQRFRLIWPMGRYLNVKSLNHAPPPAVSVKNGAMEYLWEGHKQSELVFEDNVPTWYNPFKWIQVSDFQDWSEVTDWALRLYPTTQSLSPELRQKIDSWRQKGLTELELFHEVLRFTQDEVRYLGIEFGPNSHRPSPPSTVFERRFGDCKDKTLLLCTILNDLGIEALPALVHTEYRHTITNWHASPYAFNHVIARVQVGNELHYVDPTTSSQRGPLQERYRPDYGYCLLVTPASDQLTPMPAAKTGLPKTTHTEKFNLPSTKDFKLPVGLSVTTVLEGLNADGLRRLIAQSGKEQLSKSYLNYYARIYPGINSLKPLEITDNTNVNTIVIREQYYIHDFWKRDPIKGGWLCEFYPQSIRDVLQKPATTLRKMPLAINAPLHVEQRIEIQLPEHSTLNNESKTIISKAAQLKFSARYERASTNLVLKYEYKTLADFVASANVPDYFKKQDEMIAILGYQITRKASALEAENVVGKIDWSASEKSEANRLSLLVILMLLIYVTGLIVAAVFAYRYLAATPRPGPPPLPSEIQGLRGWLLWIGFFVLINPIVLSVGIVETLPSLGQENWHRIVTPGYDLYHELMPVLIVFETALNLFFLIFSVLLVPLFFKKSAAFPKSMIVFMGASLLFLVIDQTIAKQIPYLADQMTARNTQSLVTKAIGVLLWTSYFVKSVRVKNTFIR